MNHAFDQVWNKILQQDNNIGQDLVPMSVNAKVICVCVQDRTVKVSTVFDKMTYWNLETAPSSDDTIVMAMDWPELAEAVSTFITDFKKKKGLFKDKV